jgi:hypothetical protein
VKEKEETLSEHQIFFVRPPLHPFHLAASYARSIADP